jgi:hypothetical protein
MRFTFVTSVTFGAEREFGPCVAWELSGSAVVGGKFVGLVQDFGNEGLILDECETRGRFGSTECQLDECQ